MNASSSRPPLSLAAAAFLVSADMRLPAPLLPAIGRDFRVHAGTAGLIITGYLASYALCQLGYGPFGDRIGTLRLIRISLALFAGGTAMCALAPNLGVLVGLRLLTGAAAAAVIPMGLAHLGDTVPIENRTRVISVFLSTLVAGQALGLTLGGLLAQVASWRLVFLVLGGLAAALAVALGRSDVPEDMAGLGVETPPSATASSGYFAILRRRPAFFACLGLETFAVQGAFPYVGAALVTDYGLGYAAIGLMLGLYAVGGLAGSRVPLHNERSRLRLGGTLLAASFSVIATQLGAAPSAVAILTLGIGFSLAHATLQSMATELAPTRRASALSLFSFTATALGAAGSAVAGTVFDRFGSGASFAGAAAFLALFAVLAPALLVPRTADRQRTRATESD